MYRITFVLGGDQAYRDNAMRILLATLTFVNRTFFDETPSARAPRTLKYREEACGADDWLDASALQMTGGGDCEDLACYVAGWLQSRKKIMAWPRVQTDKSGHSHVVVQLPDGRIVDPTVMLGRDPKQSHHECTGYDKAGPEQKITVVTDLFRGKTRILRIAGLPPGPGPHPQDLAHRSLMLLLHALYLIDVSYLRANPATPRLYDTGVVYQEEPPGREDWQDIPSSIHRRDADCEDLATWRAAELKVKQNIDARPIFVWRVRPSGAYLYHIQTQYPDGRVEDPSRTLGMGASHLPH